MSGSIGVAFEEVVYVFSDPLASIFDDATHSNEETRELIIGHSAKRSLLLVSFREIEPDRIRLISARAATKQEHCDYRENTGF